MEQSNQRENFGFNWFQSLKVGVIVRGCILGRERRDLSVFARTALGRLRWHYEYLV